jgi:hypothetical protein
VARNTRITAKTRADATRRGGFCQDCGELGGRCMADDRNHFVVMILSICQDIWVAVRWLGFGDVKGLLLDFGGGLSQR